MKFNTHSFCLAESVSNMLKVMLLAAFLIVMCGTFGVNSLEEPVAKSLNSADRSGSLAVPDVHGPAPAIKSASGSHSEGGDAEHSEVFQTKADSKDGQKIPSKTVKSDSDSVEKPEGSKSIQNNSSPDSSNQAEMVHSGPIEPTGDIGRKLNPEALMRGFYVFVGLSVIVMAYIAWKSFGKKPTQIHRYGVVANREDLEMAPLDSDDGEDEDTTHFDINKHRLT